MSRITISDIRSINELLSSHQTQVTAVFVGATSGIGLGTLKAFAKHVPKPRAIVVGRSEASFAPKLKELKDINPYLELTFIESDISLLKEVDKACEQIKQLVDSINLLYLSPGFINFGARNETQEGIDTCQALRYHTRLRFTTNLLHLMHAPFSRVVSVLAGGQEAGDLDYTDLELRKPGNYSVGKAGGTAAATTTLAFEKLAKENPGVGFIHIFPGLVKTGLLASSMGDGFLGFLFKWVVQPLVGFFSSTVEEVGERMLCYATSSKFSGPADTAAAAGGGGDGLRLARPTVDGCWVLNWDGKAAGNEKVLAKLRAEDGERKVWEHTLAEWERVLG